MTHINDMEPISNEIFETYTVSERADEQIRALKLLARQGYTIIDLEGQFINKWNLMHRKKFNITYNKTPKLQQH